MERFNTTPLQSRKGRQTLINRHAEIVLARHNQTRRLPFMHMTRRIELLIGLGLIPNRAAKFPFGEPQLLSHQTHRACIEYTVVRYQAFERRTAVSIEPIACNPVGHETAIARAKSAGSVLVEKIIFGQGNSIAFLQIFQRTVTPVSGNGIGEGLAIAS